MYIEYIEIALASITRYTYKIAFPFLNMWVGDIENMVGNMPSLHQDLVAVNMEYLQKYLADYSFEANEQVSRLEKIYIRDLLQATCTRSTKTTRSSDLALKAISHVLLNFLKQMKSFYQS